MKAKSLNFDKVMKVLPESELKTHNGVVIFFNEQRNFGFIHSSLDDRDYFVHRTGLIGEVKTGTHVKFSIGIFNSKPCPIEVVTE